MGLPSKSAADEPLLLPKYAPGVVSPDGMPPASPLGAVFNVSTSIVGAGMMSVPATMRMLGVVPALLLLAVAAVVAGVSSDFMVRFTRWGAVDGPAPSYASLVSDAFGSTGGVVLNASVALVTAGTLVVYLIIIGDVMCGNAQHPGVLQEWFGSAWYTQRAAVLLVTVVVFLLPLALRRRIGSLRHTSLVSIVLAIVFMLISVGMSLYAFLQGTVQAPRLFPDFAHLSSVFELFTAVPVITVAFTFHFNVHSIRHELGSNEKMTDAVNWSLAICSVLYAAVGFSGYLLFGAGTKDDVLINFDNSAELLGIPQIVSDAARISYAVHLVLVFPLLLHALRTNVDEPLSMITSAGSDFRFYSLTFALMVALYAIAVALPFIWTIFQWYGSTAAVAISMVFPGFVALRNPTSQVKDKVLAVGMLVLAAVSSTTSVAHNVRKLF